MQCLARSDHGDQGGHGRVNEIPLARLPQIYGFDFVSSAWLLQAAGDTTSYICVSRSNRAMKGCQFMPAADTIGVVLNNAISGAHSAL